jgi:pimeloyl-ACP methyl ester carboxylesterase
LVLPPRFSQELAERIPNARLVVIQDVGHQPFQEVPADYNVLLADFWQSVA